MDNQHKMIKGYRDLSEHEIQMINDIKAAEVDLAKIWQKAQQIEGVDQRALALAKTGLQEAFHWFIRAVAKPEDPYVNKE